MNKRPPKDGFIERTFNTLLVDGNALFKVGFYGAKNEYNHRAEHIGGLYQFLTIIRKILNDGLYHRVYVFWDGEFSGKLRYQFYKPYKSGRGKDYENGVQEINESEVDQKFRIKSYLEELYIRQLQHDFVESDDFIAHYCLTKNEEERITIISNDRDLSQLISEHVRIYFCDLKNYVDLTNYSEYFSHHPSNVALIKTIIGDLSDSIKGIKGVKENTLLSLFPVIKEREVTIDEILKMAQEIHDKRIEEKKKPLKSVHNLINKVTDGPQGQNIYEINSKLVNLKNPLITEDAIEELNRLKRGVLSTEDRGIKNVISYMKYDGLEHLIGTHRFYEYLLPFKKLIERENKQILN